LQSVAEISIDIQREPDEPPSSNGDRHPNTCPVCRSHYRDDELAEALRVCRHCGYHFGVGALERIAQLTDPGSFQEQAADLRSADPLAFVDLRPYVERLTEAELQTGLGDAMVVGSGAIEGHACALAVMDFGFLGGSMGSVVGEKFSIAADLAVERRIPLVSVAASGGARMQENILALMQMAKTVVAVDEVREAGLPFISICAHPTTGGVIASFASLGDVNLAEPGALMSFAGPRVVQQTLREKLPDDFGRAEANLRLGHVDAVVPRPELRGTVASLLAILAAPAVPHEAIAEVELTTDGAVARTLGARIMDFFRRRNGSGN
jgi:acetyl-CoA carboxylase carboxyl transferase beta subunit